MARIIETQTGARRIIKMSTDDIISVVKDYQRIVPRFSTVEDARSFLEDTVIFIPEEVWDWGKSMIIRQTCLVIWSC